MGNLSVNVKTESFIRPRIRKRNIAENRNIGIYSEEELTAMKNTFIGKLVNDIYKSFKNK
jgi:hypothetical protein